MQCDPVLLELLKGFPFQAIDTASDVVFALSPELTITYVNQGWSEFAENNHGDNITSRWSIGSRYIDAIPLVLRPFFLEHFAKVMNEQRPWEHQYECSSPDVYRRFLMLSYPLGKGERILVVNSIVQETPLTGTICEPIDHLYRSESGLITQCCHCRRVKRNTPNKQWDMVPAWVETIPPKTSHGLCEPCYSYYYSPVTKAAIEFPEAFKTSESG